MDKNQLFRLATVLYADNNYEVSSKTILRKIIESALLSNGNKYIDIHQLIDFIHENYNLHFDEIEITTIIKSEKEEGFLVSGSNGNTKVCLSEKRKQHIESKLNNKTIDYFISEFEKEQSTLVIGSDVKEIIYRFLYELLSSNIESFKKLIDSKRKVEDLINLETQTYTSIEREIINEFLKWDNDDKNKAIFDIASYALEYCMISNNGNGTHLQLNNLKNKIFYLDTNVIFRALGINGENRQNRTTTFLKKFTETNTQLVISKFSETEFKDTIAFYIDKLNKKPLVRPINPAIFKEKYFKSLSDIYDFYYKWRAGKFNDSLDLFEAHIMALYEKFKSDFKVTTDYKIPFEEKNDKVIAEINDLASSICSFKSQDGVGNGFNSYTIDASNILLVETKREGKSANIFEAKQFIISTDQYLRRWDYQRNLLTPIVILPSQWLSILLRYVNRTSDDFKSFVSFLNLPNTESKIQSEQLHVILSGISEMTENFEQQRHIVQTIVQKKFDGILEKGSQNDEDILERTKAFAKTELEKKIDDISKKHDNLKAELDEHKVSSSSKLSDLQQENIEKQKNIDNKDKENKRLKNKLQQNYIDGKIRKWKRPAYWAIILIVLIVLFFYFQIFYCEWEYNYIEKLIQKIDSNPSETKRDWMRAINTALALGLFSLVYFCWTRLCSNDKKEDRIRIIKENIPEEYK